MNCVFLQRDYKCIYVPSGHIYFIMKKVVSKIVSLIISAVVLVSCSDNNGTSTPDVNLAGTYDLNEVHVSSSVDVDGDGSSSNNLMDEADCISGTLTIREDMTWTFTQSAFSITSITNDQYAVQCSGTNQGAGAWASSNTEIQFQGSSLLGILLINGNQLVKMVGDDLPGVQSYVYVRR